MAHTQISREELHLPRAVDVEDADSDTKDLPAIYSLREEARTAPVPRGVLQALEFMGCMASRRARLAG